MDDPSGPAPRVAQRIDNGLAALERFLLAWAVILMAVNTVGNVIARVAFEDSLFFTEELNQFLIVLVTFVGTSAAARQGRHIRMSALTDLLTPRRRRRAMAVIQAITALVLGLLAWYATSYILRVQGLGQVTPAMRIPVWTTLLWLPLGLCIAALQFVLAAWANLRSRSDVFLAPHVRETDDVDMPTV
jgi:TRAP-type C4-dicarboxylate transport system permease small subunit